MAFISGGNTPLRKGMPLSMITSIRVGRGLVLDVVNQAHWSTIDGDTTDGIMEGGGGLESSLVHDLVILDIKSIDSVDGIHNALLNDSDRVGFCPFE